MGEQELTAFDVLSRHHLNRLDLLLVIDSSRSMADKQEILAVAVPDLVREIVNPPCQGFDGTPGPRPASSLDDCPSGYRRVGEPFHDVHIGVITSSLGDHGGDVCPEDELESTNDDMARLLTRNGEGGTVATYQGLGFLAWDPAELLDPPGEADEAALVSATAELVSGPGELGCGFESLLESWYRFLVDPNPPLTVEEEHGEAVLRGTDEVLLAQRRAFLRPDSMVAIVMLSDENDCSIRDGSQYFYAAKSQSGSGQYHLPKAQSTCEWDPNDDCCLSCAQSGDACPPKGEECEGSHDVLSDAINLRCFDQKRRFGIDFLQPIDRYVTGLTSPVVADRDGNVVDNPLYGDLDPTDAAAGARDPSLVFVAGIVGVPWQDIARRNADGQPDLLAGLNGEGTAVGGFQSGWELVNNGTWDRILGDPSCYVTDPEDCLPTDPLMIESVEPRTGTHPITGEAVAPPGAGYMDNSINGHERSIPDRDDLQYACIFPLDEARDCGADGEEVACECSDPDNDNPLCQDPTGAFGTRQYQAKAYPGRRQLELLRAMGGNGIVASICPAQLADDGRRDFGYRPAVGSIAHRLSSPSGRGPCLPDALPTTPAGRVPCTVIAASRPAGGCDCSSPGRKPVAAAHREALKAIEQHHFYAVDQWTCYCELIQLDGEQRTACQYDPSPCPEAAGEPANGWCYVDLVADPPTGHDDLVGHCPPLESRTVRFSCGAEPEPGTTTFLACFEP